MNAPKTEAGARPRVEGTRETEILEGIVTVLTESGYDRLTFDAVATQVRASKATLYRKWSTKAEMVLAAVEFVRAQTSPHEVDLDTGSLVGDLDAMFCSDQSGNDTTTELFRAVVPAMHRDTELTEMFNERFLQPKLAVILRILERARERGEIGKGADIQQLASVVPAAVTFKLMTENAPPDVCFIQSVISDVLIPACRATRDTPDPVNAD